jgi:hypothetical protein
MSNIPFEKQRLSVDLIGEIERAITAGNSVSGSDLLAAIEQSIEIQLAARLRGIVSKFFIPAVRRRGRPRNCRGREDFALEEVDARYPRLLRKYEKKARQSRRLAAAKGAVLPSAQRTPSESAYSEILQDMQTDFPNVDWKALCNKHSAWNTGHFHSSESHIDSQDFEAEIERQFPTPKPHNESMHFP